MLGLLLGILCEAHLIIDPKILKLLVLGIIALLISGIGSILGGYIMYFITGGKFNPVIGIAAVSCVPTIDSICINNRINPKDILRIGRVLKIR